MRKQRKTPSDNLRLNAIGLFMHISEERRRGSGDVQLNASVNRLTRLRMDGDLAGKISLEIPLIDLSPRLQFKCSTVQPTEELCNHYNLSRRAFESS